MDPRPGIHYVLCRVSTQDAQVKIVTNLDMKEIDQATQRVLHFGNSEAEDQGGCFSPFARHRRSAGSLLKERRILNLMAQFAGFQFQTCPKCKPKAMPTGFVKKLLKEKGFGFLRPDDGGADLFAPLRNFSGDEDSLNEGDKVTFEVEVEERTQKPKAASWSVTSASAAASLLALSGALAQVIP
eukprot:symbB.v1.2.009808.t1/scaffold614.1/size180566/18